MSADITNDETIGGVPTVPHSEPSIVVAGRYRTIRLVARGGMASVYLAEQIALHRPVALKILSPPPVADLADQESFERRFRLEAETLATLVHPNIVTIFDYGEAEDGRFFLAMEYIDGPRLTDLLVHGALEPDRALKLLLQVCNALRYAHRRGVVHRDLKPSNLLITKDAEGHEQVKVVDFGLVKVGEVDQSLTREGVVMGSPHCMAPEQVQGQQVDARADIYAIGVLLYRCLTGTYPFHGSNATATMMAHLTQDVPPFVAVAPTLRVHTRVEGIARRCLAREPQDRYQDVVLLAKDLGESVGLAPELETQSLVLDDARPAPPRRSPLVWVAAAAGAGLLLLAVIVAAVVGLGRGPSEDAADVLAAPSPPVAPLTGAAPPLAAAGAELPAALSDPPAEAVEPGPADAAPAGAPAPSPAPPPAPPAAKAARPAAKPATKPAPAAAPAPADENPPGYMPLPDDLK